MSGSGGPIQFFSNPRQDLPFSRAVRVGDVLYLSGQIGVRPDGVLPDDFAEQVRQTMDNIAATLGAVGSSMDSVFKCLVMLEDMSRWPEFNAVYLQYFPADKLPARSAFGVGGLAGGAVCEVEAWAYAPRA